MPKNYGHVAEQVYAYGSEPYLARVGGSNPLVPTILEVRIWNLEFRIIALLRQLYNTEFSF